MVKASRTATKRTSARGVSPRRKSAKTKTTHAGKSKTSSRWSASVMKTSDAMDLKAGIFKQRSGLAIARSLKASAERSSRRKSPPFRSAMSMLNFEINRGGTNLTEERRRILNQAKVQLRRLFGRKPSDTTER